MTRNTWQDLIDRIASAHARTGAPGEAVGCFLDGRYIVEVARAGGRPHRRAFRFETKPGNRVTVHPCWTERTPDGKAVQHRRSATE